MDDNTHMQVNNLLYSCMYQKQRGHEQFVHEHSLGYVIAGEMKLQTGEGLITCGSGSMGLIRRNQLAKSVKVPPVGGGEFKSVNIFLDQDFLRRYSVEHKLPPAKYAGPPLLPLADDPFLKGYFDSLLPYFNQGRQLDAALADLKTKEAVELLLRHDRNLAGFLFDFSEPYKIDLEAYMNRHYMFNVSMEQFARLTGRSLAGFKRDFEKVFGTSPGQWLQQKRLSEAYYQISEKGRKPSDVYLDVGFENLSHFSYSFKKTYGVAPSMV